MATNKIKRAVPKSGCLITKRKGMIISIIGTTRFFTRSISSVLIY